MKHQIGKESGFTLVELAIVIVVISILATITAVGYKGLQERARNHVRTEAAQQFNDILKLSLVKNTPAAMIAAMDHSDGWDKACLGTGYPDVDGDGKGDCAAFDGDPYISDTPSFNTLLARTALPSMSKYPKYASNDGDVVYGPYVNVETVEGVDVITMEYLLEGEGQNCMVKPLIYQRPNGARKFTPLDNPNYTTSAYGVTECWVIAAKVP